jgi:cysteinyl-tRNA synthetase, unknown class
MLRSDIAPRPRDARARFAAMLLAFTVCMSMSACGGGTGGAPSTSAAATSSAASAASAASGTSGASAASVATTNTMTAAPAISVSRALPSSPAWTVYYGRASNIDIAKAAATFKLIVIDADPGTGTPQFSAAQIAALKANGAKVLSYLNFGACEKSRSYWNTVPSGFVSCGANGNAQIAKYQGYQEYWMNPADPDYQNLIVNHVAPRLAATGVDGFMLDNFEIVGHGANSSSAPCDASCAQGGLDLVKQLRDRFPDLAIVPNGAPVAAIGGTSGGVSFPWLIDGVLAEQVYLPSTSAAAVNQLKSWQSTGQNLGRGAFFAGSLDYASSCTATSAAQGAWTAALAAGFSPAIATSALDSICWWTFLPTAG